MVRYALFGRQPAMKRRGLFNAHQPSRGKRGACVLLIAAAVGLAVLAGCGGGSEDAPAVPTAASVASAAQPSPAAPEPTATPSPSPEPAMVPGPELRAGELAVVLGEGSRARYRVREELARVGFPTDAVGETPDATGLLVFGADGALQPERSRLEVDLRTLESDSSRRDGYVRNNTLETSSFPTAVFVPREARGLPWPLPGAGEVTFQLEGDMTVHGVTKPLVWEVTAQLNGESATGQAKTSFTFEVFEMTKPQVFVVISVDENIRLELDFIAGVTRGA